MINTIKKEISIHINQYIQTLDKKYCLKKQAPVLFSGIKDFLSRKSKKARSILFVLAYQAYAKKKIRNLYNTALSIELLHNSMLIHDDIIDKSPLRNSALSMHSIFDNYLKKYKNLKFTGQDLAILTGDFMYALAIDVFLSTDAPGNNKENVLKQFTQAALYSAYGEFIELIYSVKGLAQLKKKDIYRIYDYKTAYYTFCLPLTAGAILAGANKQEVNRINKYGLYMGRAFQIKDDISDIAGDERKTQKTSFSDLKSAKRTILIWHAYNKSTGQDKKTLKLILDKKNITTTDINRMRRIISDCNSLAYAKKEIQTLIKKGRQISRSFSMPVKKISILNSYSGELLNPD